MMERFARKISELEYYLGKYQPIWVLDESGTVEIEARANLAQTIDSVCDNHEAVIITKKNDRAVVMLSLEDYQALEETSYLLRSPSNARRLLDSINELDSGGGTEKELKE